MAPSTLSLGAVLLGTKAMQNNTQVVTLQKEVGQLKKDIEDEIDWYIAYANEKDSEKKKIYFAIFESKKKKTAQLAKENYEKYK